jgi:hypothetical protein
VGGDFGRLSVALVPFFAFREIARALGEAEFRTLMLGTAKERHQAAVLAIVPAQ